MEFCQNARAVEYLARWFNCVVDPASAWEVIIDAVKEFLRERRNVTISPMDPIAEKEQQGVFTFKTQPPAWLQKTFFPAED